MRNKFNIIIMVISAISILLACGSTVASISAFGTKTQVLQSTDMVQINKLEQKYETILEKLICISNAQARLEATLKAHVEDK